MNASSGQPSTRDQSPFSPSPYSASGLTAAATFAGSVHGVVVQTTSDSPSRPHERKADEERRMLELDVVLLAGLLVLRERGPATRAPLRRAVSLVQPAAAVHLLQEAPDVLDVRVAERVVVVVPVHPHPEPRRLLGDHVGEARDALLAALGELGEPVLLDLALRVEAELLLDLDLDPEPLAVEPVLVALVEAAQRLVALEHVLQRPAQAWWTPIGLFAVIGPSMKLNVGPPRFCSRSRSKVRSLVPEFEDLPLERRMIRDRRKRREAFAPCFRF